METTKHTPGPWTIRDRYADVHYCNVVADESERSHMIVAEKIGIIANARLIAAAPTLLELARATLEILNEQCGFDPHSPIIVDLKAAIDKAEGGAA